MGHEEHFALVLDHRPTALEDSSVMEASTTEVDDVLRLEDRYGRVTA